MKMLTATMIGALLLPVGASAQESPSASISMVVPFAAGGPTQAIAEPLAEAMAANLGNEVNVEMVPGKGGTVGAARVAESDPDGQTILLYHIGMATAPTLYPDLPFDPVEDFEPIGLIAEVPMVLVGRNDLPPKTLEDLVAYVKEHDGEVTIADAGIGSASHLCGTLFMSAIQTQLTVKHYDGTGPAMKDLLAGDVDLICDPSSGAARRVEAGEVRGYVVTSGERLAPLASLPTAAESGLPSFELAIWYGLFAPAGTPEETIDRLAGALQAALQDPKVIDSYAATSTLASPEKATPAALEAKLEAEIDRWKPLLEAAGGYAD